jgi:nitrite reductase (NO-forming)
VALVLLVLVGIVLAPLGQRQAKGPAAAAFQPAGPNGHVVNVDLTAIETTQTIVPAAAGGPVTYSVWTFDGTAPGPVIRVHLGDTVRFTLRNASTIGMQHSVDFHAAMTPWADLPAAGGRLTGNYQPVDPGQSKTFSWTAMYPGVFMYHCGVNPVLQHIANGMYGAIVVVPDNLPREREYVLVNSEFYPGATPIQGVYYGDYNAMLAADPKYVVWNGVADIHKTSPLMVRPDEKFRLWVMNAGPTLTSAFHVIGTMFNAYADGNPANAAYGLQTYNIAPGGGAMFELQIPDPGLYPFVTHAFAFTGRGAVGLIRVDPAAAPPPASYPVMGDPFTAGLKAFAPPAALAAIVTPRLAASPAPTAATSIPSHVHALSATPQASAAPAACAPSGPVVRVSARNMVFDSTCLAAPANTPFTIAFQNEDPGIPHNVAIYKDPSASSKVFVGEMVSGPVAVTYQVPALKPGTYYFRCDIHPAMDGTFIVQ